MGCVDSTAVAPATKLKGTPEKQAVALLPAAKATVAGKKKTRLK